jgi:predicted N-acetyltransferase YhbS
MPTNSYIRQGREADAERLKAVINDAFRNVEAFFVDGDRISMEEVLELLATGAFLLLEDEEVIHGCVYVDPKRDAYLGLLSVAPEHQKRGVGSTLMEAAEDFCRNAGSQTINIKIVHLRKELPDFYSKRGYVETGTSAFPPDIETKVPVYFVDMRKTL